MAINSSTSSYVRWPIAYTFYAEILFPNLGYSQPNDVDTYKLGHII